MITDLLRKVFSKKEFQKELTNGFAIRSPL